MAGSIITPGFEEPAAALIDNTVDGTNWIQAAFKTKNNARNMFSVIWFLIWVAQHIRKKSTLMLQCVSTQTACEQFKYY